MLAIQNATLVMRDHLVPDGTLLIEDGRIIAVGEASAVSRARGVRKAGRRRPVAGPGLIDMHTHRGRRQVFSTRTPSTARAKCFCTALPAFCRRCIST